MRVSGREYMGIYEKSEPCVSGCVSVSPVLIFGVSKAPLLKGTSLEERNKERKRNGVKNGTVKSEERG